MMNIILESCWTPSQVAHMCSIVVPPSSSTTSLVTLQIWPAFGSNYQKSILSYLIPHATPHTNANTNTNTNMYGNTQIVKPILSSSDTTVYTSYLHQCQVQLTHWVFVQKNLSMEMFIIDLINSSYFHPFTIVESNMIILFSWFN